MTRSFLLRTALGGNAGFSFSTGLFMTLRPDLVAGLTGADVAAVYRVIGIGLVMFAAELLWQATRRRIPTWRALGASMADFVWVLGTVVLLAAFSGAFSARGVLVLGIVGAIVFGFGLAQLAGILRIHAAAAPGRYRHCVVVATDAPASAMWRIIGNLGRISEFVPSLKHSAMEEGKPPAPGAVRHCSDYGGRRWAEECTEYREGQGFALRFRTEAADFPFPAKEMAGGWEVAAAVGGGSEVTVWLEMTPRHQALAPFVVPVMGFAADRQFPRVVAAMAREAAPELRVGESGSIFGPARVLPRIC